MGTSGLGGLPELSHDAGPHPSAGSVPTTAAAFPLIGTENGLGAYLDLRTVPPSRGPSSTMLSNTLS